MLNDEEIKNMLNIVYNNHCKVFKAWWRNKQRKLFEAHKDKRIAEMRNRRIITK